SSKLMALRKVLASDPRPHYQHDDNRVYGLEFNRQNIHFSIKNGKISVFLSFFLIILEITEFYSYICPR
ncbi:MAG: hypothetical protein J6032_00335, partial [Bacteroidales bacterium]|nr:hypothetical protein [Bacteroidales bacterium]